MQIAGNALAFRHFGEVLNFFIGLTQPAVHAVAFGEKGIAGADDNREQRTVKQSPAIDVQKPSFNCPGRSDNAQTEDGSDLSLYAKGKHRRRKDEERASTCVDGQEKEAQQ